MKRHDHRCSDAVIGSKQDHYVELNAEHRVIARGCVLQLRCSYQRVQRD